MHILYDSQIFWYQNYGGISNYFTNMLDAAYNNKIFNFHLSARFSNNKYLVNKPFVKNMKFTPNIDFFAKRTIFFPLNLVNNNITLNLLRKEDFDLFHPTYYNTYYLSKLKIPLVLTAFDCIPEKFPEYYPRGEFNNEKKTLFENAEKIICISKNTKLDLMKFYGVQKNKLEVVYLAANLSDVSTKIDLPKKYILFVGSRDKYKNFDFFIKSIADVLIKNKISLFCVGTSFSIPEKKLLNELKLSKLVFVKEADQGQLKYLYQNALLFVFPSLYEGFGIPIIEAMSVGCPVALSNTSCFPEIAQKNAVYFDPTNQESIKNCVENLLFNKKKRNLLSKKGLKHSECFSWKKTAIETKKIYKGVI